MTLETNASLGAGGTGFHGRGPGTAERMIRELQAVKSAVVAGAAADADITVTGIMADDTLESVTMFDTGVPSDVTAEASITDDDTVVLDTTNSTGNQLLVRWWTKPTS
jgi:hypothetical protein